jgi:hypothetical protein
VDNQSGIGGLLGLAAKYDFDFGGTFYVNPCMKFHAIIPFSPEDNQQRIYESGIRLGFIYKLNNKK